MSCNVDHHCERKNKGYWRASSYYYAMLRLCTLGIAIIKTAMTVVFVVQLLASTPTMVMGYSLFLLSSTTHPPPSFAFVKKSTTTGCRSTKLIGADHLFPGRCHPLRCANGLWNSKREFSQAGHASRSALCLSSSSPPDTVTTNTIFISDAQLGGDASSSSTNGDRQQPQQQEQPHPGRLHGAVCVVTGASRGIGKAIALELGKEGAIVYVTGRSSSSSLSSSSQHLDNNSKPSKNDNNASELDQSIGTVEETADAINQFGGIGIPVICNHARDDEVHALFQKIQNDHGRIDILVNNAFALPRGATTEQLSQPFWQDVNAQIWDAQHTVGLRSHYVASCHAVPIMLSQQHKPVSSGPKRMSASNSVVPRPLIVMIGSFGGISYTFNVAYGVAKAGVDRLVKDMAVELTRENICVVSLWPGVVMTERNQRAIQSGEWQKHVGLPLDQVESPALTGKVVVELALDANNMQKTGTYQVVAELAQDDAYGINITDDGMTTPPSIRSLKFLLPAYGLKDSSMKQWIPSWLIPDWKLPFWVMAQGRPDGSAKS